MSQKTNGQDHHADDVSFEIFCINMHQMYQVVQIKQNRTPYELDEYVKIYFDQLNNSFEKLIGDKYE
jgi:hypothetical protein|tara:strand:+ start:695 stop:895 length:201 start_codon:yes stop_codon:yes gene_type:complete